MVDLALSPTPLRIRTVLHLGAASASPPRLHRRFLDGSWRQLRVDDDPGTVPDVLGSLTDLSGIDSGSVDAIWSGAGLERLESHQVPRALTEMRRVLVEGGELLLCLPDLERVAALVLQGRLDEPVGVSPHGPITPLDLLYGNRAALAAGDERAAHRCGFSAQTLAAHLRRAGFGSVQVRKGGDLTLWAEATKVVGR